MQSPQLGAHSGTPGARRLAPGPTPTSPTHGVNDPGQARGSRVRASPVPKRQVPAQRLMSLLKPPNACSRKLSTGPAETTPDGPPPDPCALPGDSFPTSVAGLAQRRSQSCSRRSRGQLGQVPRPLRGCRLAASRTPPNLRKRAREFPWQPYPPGRLRNTHQAPRTRASGARDGLYGFGSLEGPSPPALPGRWRRPGRRRHVFLRRGPRGDGKGLPPSATVAFGARAREQKLEQESSFARRDRGGRAGI